MSTEMARLYDDTLCEVLAIGAYACLVRYNLAGHECVTWEPREDIEFLEKEESYEMC